MRISEISHGIVRTESGREIELHSRVGEGGEGSVFHVGGCPNEVAKLYNDKMDAGERAEKAKKLGILLGLNDEKLRSAAAWPIEILVDDSANRIGFVMEYLTGYQPLFMAYQIKTRLKRLDGRDFGFLVRVASNLAACVHFVHGADLVIGDLNESNVLVTAGAMVKLIDADSFQVRTTDGYLTPGVGKTELLPPELQGKSLDNRVRTPEEDRFSLAVLIFQTLVFGRHPFAGRTQDRREISLEESIEQGWYAYGTDAMCPVRPPPNIDIGFLPPHIRAMFEDAFLIGRVRPTAEEWHLALRQLEVELKPCKDSSAHLFWKDSDACPWCAMESSLKIALFASKRLNRIEDCPIDFATLEAEIDLIEAPSIESELPPPDKYLSAPTRVPWWERVLAYGSFKNLSFIYIFLSIQIVKALSNAQGVQEWIVFFIGTLLAIFCLASLFRPAWLKHKMRHLDRRFVSLEQQWTISASLALFEQKKYEYRECIQQLRQLESKREELERDARRLKFGHLLDSYLSRYSIAIADVPVGNRDTLDMLIDRGIRTAADISRPVLLNVVGKHSSIVENLSNWVASLEIQFWKSTAHPLDDQDAEQIDHEIHVLRTQLTDKLNSASKELVSFGKQLKRNQETLLREYETFASDFAIQRSLIERYNPAASTQDESQSVRS